MPKLIKKSWTDSTVHIIAVAEQVSTGCGSHFENPTNFKILKEPLLVQKQALHQQKALDLCYLESEGQRRGIIMRTGQCHRRQRVKNPPRTCKKSTKNVKKRQKNTKKHKKLQKTLKN